MIEADGRDGSAFWGDDIGRIKATAKPDFENEIIGFMLRKCQKSGCCGDFKKRNRCTLIGRFDARQHVGQMRF